MGADLNNIVKTQRLSDDHVQFLVYQILRGLKACKPHTHTQTDRHTHLHTDRQTDRYVAVACIPMFIVGC